jgi:FkbM family methyltransferase
MSSLSQFVSRAQASVRSRLGLPPPLVQKQILGRSFVVRESSVRDRPDYDDAWRLACALRAEVIFDVGANVGQAALTELQSRKLKLLVLIEANPEALSIAAENIIRNHLSTSVFFVPAFIGDVNHSTVKFWTVGTGQAGSMYQDHARSAVAAGHFKDVPTMTLDYLCFTLQCRIW